MADLNKKKKPSAEKKKDTSIFCPPDIAGRGTGLRFFGTLCRMLVVLFAVYGLSLMFGDAARLEVGALYLFIAAAASVSVFTLFYIPKVGGYIGTGAILIYAVLRFVLTPQYPRFVITSLITVYNSFLERLASRNFIRMVDFMIDIDVTGFGKTELQAYGMALFTVILAAVFVPCLVRRTKILAPAAISAVILVVLFTYNLSNANWAFALILASFSALLVLKVYDDIYMRGAKRNRQPETSGLFVDTNRPEMPSEALIEQAKREDEKAQKQAEREQKADLRRRQREQALTIDEEISNYFDTPSKKPKREKPEKVKRGKKDKATRTHENEIKKQIKRVHRYDAVTRSARSSAGGFAAMGTFIVMMAILVFPALFTKSSFADIPFISERMEFYREYVTAFLQGEEMVLDDLDYADNAANFAPRSTTATKRNYNGTQFFFIETASAQPIYMTGWIATDYRDGAWYTAGYHSETNAEYRSLYSSKYDRQSTPYESVYFNFMNAYYPYDVRVNEFEDNRQSISSAHGYIAEQVNIRRLAEIGSPCYFPSRFALDYELRSYGSSAESGLTYVNFFDGIYTGNGFAELNAEYAVVSFLMDQSNSNWYKNISNYIAQFNEGYTVALEQVLEPRRSKIEMYRDRPDTIARIVSTLYTDVVVNYSEGKITVFLPEGYIGSGTYVITEEETQEYGMAHRIICEERQTSYLLYSTGEIMRSGLNGNRNTIDLPFAVRYAGLMTNAERTEIASMYYDYFIYRNYVYETYSGTADSEIITKYYNDLIEGLSEEEYNELFTDGNGLEYRGSRINSVNAVTYENRHELIMKIISTLAAKDSGYTYTLDPTATALPNLDGVENFLTVTKEGYCVQFASAVALLLREAGIPARYVEGYVASAFTKNQNRDPDWTWSSIVKDEDAHAWVEVWYDGIGWIQYEATPTLYNKAYGIVDETPPDDTDETSDTNSDETTPPEDTEDTEDTTFSITDYYSDLTEPSDTAPGGFFANLDPELIKKVIIAAVILILLAALTAAAVIWINRRAERFRLEKLEFINMIVERRVPEAERHATAKRLIDMTMKLLELYGTPPGKTEFRDDYAERLEKEYLSIFGKDVRNPESDTDPEAPAFIKVSDTDIKAIFTEIAAEEFGVDGMSEDAMAELAEFYKRLSTALPARVSNFDRFIYTYIKPI